MGYFGGDHYFVARVLWLARDFKPGVGLGGFEHHAVAALLSPNLGQEVLLVHLPEHELLALFARVLLLAMGEDGGSRVAVLDRDRGIQRFDRDSIGASRHMRGSYVEGEGYSCHYSGLCVSAGGGEEGRESPERKGCEQIAFHNILLGAPFTVEPELNFCCVGRAVRWLPESDLDVLRGGRVTDNLDLSFGFGGRHRHA